VWDKGSKETQAHWKPRKKKTQAIGRLVAMHPSKGNSLGLGSVLTWWPVGDVYFLRMLLTHEHCVRKTSYEEMLMLNGRAHPTYQSVCANLGLLEDDREWHVAMADASLCSMPSQMRALYVAILLFCNPNDPVELLFTFVDSMWEDFERDQPAARGREWTDLVLLDIADRLECEGKHPLDFGLPVLDDARRANLRQSVAASRYASVPREVREQLEHDVPVLRGEVDRRLVGEIGTNEVGKYRPAQRDFHDRVMRAVRDPTVLERLFFLEARAGTGKTYVENGLICDTRLIDGNVALAVAISGIAATLMYKASTFHSRFKAPLVGLDGNTVFNVRRGTKEADLLKRATLIVWDEVSMGHRHLLEALDRTLRDICGVGKSSLASHPPDLVLQMCRLLGKWSS
jgi:ATP-dependent DNA helicase PIF1